MNFTLQEFLGATLAFRLFLLVIVLPGYIVGWALIIFDHSKHTYAWYNQAELNE